MKWPLLCAHDWTKWYHNKEGELLKTCKICNKTKTLMMRGKL